jgi:ketosteroid isomerase-like protein
MANAEAAIRALIDERIQAMRNKDAPRAVDVLAEDAELPSRTRCITSAGHGRTGDR